MAKARVQHQVRTAAHLRQDLVLQRGVARQAGRRVSTDTSVHCTFARWAGQRLLASHAC